MKTIQTVCLRSLFCAAVVLSAFAPTASRAQDTGVKLLYSIGKSSDFNNPQPLIGSDSFRLSSPDDRTHIGIGLYGRFLYDDLKPFFLQVEAFASRTTATYTLTPTVGNSSGHSFTLARYNFDVPVMVGFRIGPVHGMAGVVPGVTFATPSKDFTEGWQETFNALRVGYTYGLGFDIWRLNLDARIQNDLGQRLERVPSSEYAGKQDLLFNHAQVVFTVGFKLSKKQKD